MAEYEQLLKSGDQADKEYSPRIILQQAKDVKYTTTFGANTLILRI